MTFTPRLVALDVDGTVVSRDGELAVSVVDAVARVVAAGVPIVVATGRDWTGTKPVVEALGLPPGPHVCSNGAVEIDHPSGRPVRVVTFDPRDVIRAVHREVPEAIIAVEDFGRGFLATAPFPPGEIEGDIAIVDVDTLCSQPVSRVVVRDPHSSPEVFAALAERLGMHGVGYFVGWTAWLDISPAGVDKATALADVAARLGVAQADVLAIGDGHNDVGMLSWAGRGVAVGDAPVVVKAVADAVTGTFAEGGTAAELRRWF